MTVICAKVCPFDRSVWVAADRAMFSGQEIVSERTKIWRACGAIFGAAGTNAWVAKWRKATQAMSETIEVLADVERIAEVLHAMEPPPRCKDEDVPALIVATKFGVYTVDDCGSVALGLPRGAAVGSGREAAAGALHVTEGHRAVESVAAGVEAAQAVIYSCAGGQDIWCVDATRTL